ncbi:MAG: hypothetical protein ACLRSW_01215 [Christensenellaceae bacterium]
MKKFLAIVLAAATIGMGAAGMAGCKDRDENTIVGRRHRLRADGLSKRSANG